MSLPSVLASLIRPLKVQDLLAAVVGTRNGGSAERNRHCESTIVASSEGLPSRSAAGEKIAGLVEVSTWSRIDGTDAVAAPAAGAATLLELLLPPLNNPANAAHPLSTIREKTGIRN